MQKRWRTEQPRGRTRRGGGGEEGFSGRKMAEEAGERRRILKLVNRTRSSASRFTFCAGTFATLPLVFLLLVLRSSPSSSLSLFISLSLGLFLLRSATAASSLPRRTLHPRLRGSDNGGLALSSWFIASFDCQVHADESTRPPFAYPLLPVSLFFLSLSLSRPLLLPPPTSTLSRAPGFCRTMFARRYASYGTYGSYVCS